MNWVKCSAEWGFHRLSYRRSYTHTLLYDNIGTDIRDNIKTNGMRLATNWTAEESDFESR
jgi:hypothetical protein